VLGYEASNRVTISNSEIDGSTSWSATCDGHHYWGLYFTGSNDLITLKGNYIHHTSGRSPKVGGNTLLHAVNNYWYANSGHAFEVDAGSMVVVEGSVFQNVVNEVEASSFKGKMFNSPDTTSNAACASYLGHSCQLNAFGSSTGYSAKDTSFFSNFQGKNIASASTASSAQSTVPNSAGFGKI
jgi:pectin lyase